MKRFLILVSLLAISTFALAATINLNAATRDQIAGLPNMSAVKAKAIVDYRTAKGCFKNLSDLLKVDGVSQSDLDGLNGLAVVGSCPGRGPRAGKAETS